MANTVKYLNSITGFKAQVMQLEAFRIEEEPLASNINKIYKGNPHQVLLANLGRLVSLQRVYRGKISSRMVNIKVKLKSQVLNISNKVSLINKGHNQPFQRGREEPMEH